MNCAYLKIVTLALGILLLAACGKGPVSAPDTRTADEKAIRDLENRFAAAVRARNLDSIMQFYVPGGELVVFDVAPPSQYVGVDAWRKAWQDFFAAYPGPVVQFEVPEDLKIETAGTLAYSHGIYPFIITAKDGSKFTLTGRVTDAYRKINGNWFITHEHISVPVDLSTGKAVPVKSTL